MGCGAGRAGVVSIWGSDVTLDERHPAGLPYVDCMDAAGFYAAGDKVVTAQRAEGGWLDVATTPLCDMVRLCLTNGEAGRFDEVFLDEPQVRAVVERLSGWLDEVAARRAGSVW